MFTILVTCTSLITTNIEDLWEEIHSDYDTEYLSRARATIHGAPCGVNTDNEGGAQTLLSVLDATRRPMNGGSSPT